MPDIKGPNELVTEAYNIQDKESMVAFYRKWATAYDRVMLEELGYESPMIIAQQLRAHLADTDASIFDIGCGTGLTCVFLADSGYSNLDGIDISTDMVRVAGERGIYRELLVGDVNLPLERDDASYDGVISSGTFTHGHVGPDPMGEIFRVLKPGGILACTIHQDLWESMGFDTKLAALIESGTAEQISLEKSRYYKSGPPEGWFCVYRKSS